VQAAEQVLAVQRTTAQAEEASFALAQAQAAAGNISDLVASNEKTLYLQSRLDVARGEADAAAAREQLTRLMGLNEPGWQTSGRLPDIPASEVPLAHLDNQALRDRLDLAALRQEVQTLDYALGLAKTSRWSGVIDIGVDVARLKDGRIAVGPRASLELPIFDQRQAPIARLESELRRTQQLLAARIVEVKSEIRLAQARLAYARQVAEQYASSIIPTREHVVALSQQEYNSMLLGVYQLVAAKQSEISAYGEYITAVRDYWTARADLERALGGPIVVPSTPSLPAAPQPNPLPSEPLPAPPPGHHHHPS
jgi:cobalt-zinc-cadmium efflux system outer membrane protein